MTIWKFPVPVTDRFALEMPAPARFLSFVRDPAGEPCVWFMVNPDDGATVRKSLAVIGTGNPLPLEAAGWLFLGTLIDTPFVWHLFDVGGAP